MNIAQTILEQIKAVTPRPVFWSWGASSFKAVGENQIKGVDQDYLGALVFYVRGRQHKGHVMVSLALSDTYTVSIGNVRKGEIKVKEQVRDVFFEELGTVIDEMVEKVEEYAY